MANYKNIELAKGVFWIGTCQSDTGGNYNPYLIIDGNEAVLIDPGPVAAFDCVFQNMKDLIDISALSYIIVQQPSPEVTASLPLYEKQGVKARVIVHERALEQIKALHVSFDFFIINDEQSKLTLKSGRELFFIETPYLHSYAAIISYDAKTKSLFSSVLFGADPFKWDLFAGRFYRLAMMSFHERLMPGNDVIRPVMEMLLKIDIEMIAPHKGSIIKENIPKYIRILRDLECGIFVNPLKHDLTRKEGYIAIANKVLDEFISRFSSMEVLEVFRETEIIIDENTYKINPDFHYTGEELWEKFFSVVYSKKGLSWISVIEEFVDKIIKKYGVDKPDVFKSIEYQKDKVVRDIDMQKIDLYEKNVELDKEKQALDAERMKLERKRKDLRQGLREYRKNLVEKTKELRKCKITNLNNESVLIDFFKRRFRGNDDFALILIDIDRITDIKIKYGRKGEQKAVETIKILGEILNQERQKTHPVFKMSKDTSFAYFMNIKPNDAPKEIAENIRNKIKNSERFQDPITVSIGVVYRNELEKEEQRAEDVLRIANVRVLIAKRKGMNMVVDSSAGADFKDKILIVDSDQLNVDIIETKLNQMNYNVVVCKDGIKALEILEKEDIKLVIAEMMIPKLDGFGLREKMLSSSSQKNIPYILISYMKDELTIQRALEMKIDYYFKKPFFLAELTGVARNLIQSQTSEKISSE